MRKLFFSFVFLGLLGILSAGADYVRWDVNLHVPVMVGLASQEGNAQFEEISKYKFLIPEIQGQYFLDFNPLRVGLGARLYTVLIQSFILPSVSAEVELGPFTLSGGIAGGAFASFGLATQADFSNIWLPQILATVELFEGFDLGVAGTGLLYSSEEAQESLPYFISAFVRFRIGGPPASE